MLRSAAIDQIIDALEQSGLTRFDFEIRPQNKDACFSISSLMLPTCLFSATSESPKASGYPLSVDYKFTVSMTPGNLTSNDKLQCDDFATVCRLVQAWGSLIREEVRTGPQRRTVESVLRSASEIRDQTQRIPDEPIPVDLGSEWRSQLDQLQAELEKKLAEHIEDKNKLQNEVRGLKADIQFLKDAVDCLTQRGWATAVIARLKKWTGNPAMKNALPVFQQASQRLLPDLNLISKNE